MKTSQLISLSRLLVTHNELRDVETVKYYLNILNTNFLTGWSAIGGIKIADFGDRVFVRDGHNRCVALYCYMQNMGEPWLPAKLMEREYYTYAAFQEIDFADNWCTPFNPITQVRKADFKSFKEKAFEIYNKHGREPAELFVLHNQHLYLEERNIHTVKDLYLKYKQQIEGEEDSAKESDVGIITCR